MKMKYLTLSFVSLSVSISFDLFGQDAGKPRPYSAIYAFGDCLTDTHNVEPPWVPNWRGRYSNGPMWIELISTNLDLIYIPGNNFARSGATTSGALAQVNAFSAGSNASHSLFVIWAGPCDFYLHLGTSDFGGPFASPTNDTVWNPAIERGVNNLSNAVVRLYGKGARSFLVANCDDVSRQPVVIRTHSAETRAGLQGRVHQFNSTLAEALARLDQSLPDVRILSADAFGLLSAFCDHPADYAMTKTFPAAVDDEGLTDLSFSGPGADYVFWQEYGHPTTKAHALIGARFLTDLQQTKPEKLSVLRQGQSLTLQADKLLTGRAYSLQSSSDLSDWRDLFSFTAQAGSQQFPVSQPASPTTYFRLTWSAQ